MADQLPGTQLPSASRQLRSLVTPHGTVQVTVIEQPTPLPSADQVLVRIEAAPINPSDLGMMLAGADLSTVRPIGGDGPGVEADLSPGAARAAAGRTGRPMPVGNEGAGTVVASGDDPAARALVGRTVAVFAGGGTYGEHVAVHPMQCLVLDAGTTAVEGASCFVNPLTALGMVDTMRIEGHTALVHTAAASNLGQMLNRICLADGVPLVNIVRRPEHVELLRAQGATHVCDSSAPSFMSDLVGALTETGATIAFDAIGGGALAGQILTAMEAVASATMMAFSRYGSSVHKQVYIYGGLDRGPTELTRSFGFSWGVGGWLLTPFLARIGPDKAQRLRERVAAEVHTTFASHYAGELTLDEVVDPAHVAIFGRMATGEKFLVRPDRG